MKKNLTRFIMLTLLIVVGLSTRAQNVAKIGNTEYSTFADAVTAAKTGDEVVIIASDTYTIPNLPKNITIKAGENVEVVFNCEGSGSIASVPNGATFEGVTMNFGQTSYHGFQHAGTINMKGCTLNGLFFSYGDMNFNKCTFKQDSKEYMMWDYGKDLTYTDCVFYGKGKFINVYNEGNGNWKLTVSGCTFNNDGEANKAPLNIKETCGTTLLGWDVTIGKDNKLVGNFPENKTSDDLIVGGDGLWQVDDRCSDHTQSLVVVKDAEGKVLYEAEKKPAPAEEIKIDEDLEITPTEGGSELTDEQKTAATEAIYTLASNPEASTLPEETKVSNTTAVKDEVLKEGQSVIVDVAIKSATVDATDGIVIKQVTFDVTPYVAENGKATENKIANENIEKPITFRLPVAASVTDTQAAVYHEGAPLGVKNIVTGTEGSKYIEISSTEFSEFSYALMSTIPAPESIDYYAGSSTKQTGTIEAFTSAAATSKNAIAIVSSEYSSIAELYSNVLVEYDNGGVKNYVCPKFVLDDMDDFYTPVDFTAKTGSYSRSNTAGMNSVCMPFAIDKTMLSAENIGTFVSANLTGEDTERTGTISFKSNESVEAGTPCIVKCSETVTSWNVAFNNTHIVAQPNNANALQGTFISKVIGVNYFKVSGDGTMFVNSQEGSHNYAFRACLDLTSDSELGFVKALDFVWDDETTGISDVNVDDAVNSAYDLAGRKVNKLIKGNMYIVNGKKIIIK